tara:strand:- start:7736 stop:8455 length:720 start_codon:yes stop_codon:yes gene_type:complete
MFDPYLLKLNNYLQGRGGHRLSLPSIFQECKSYRNQENIIKSWLWSVPGFRRWRVTRLDAGESLQVLNSVAYPDLNNDQPILGLDLLWFGKNSKLVAVMDFQPLVQDEIYLDRYFNGLKLLRNRYPQLSNKQIMRAFDPNQYFSPWLLFFRGDLEESEGLLANAFNDFLYKYGELSDLSKHSRPLIQSSEVLKLQNAYDKYGSEKDPAHGLFKSYFGEEWTNKYLYEFLFPGSSFVDKN